MFSRNRVLVMGVILSLITAILVPVFLSGINDENAARIALSEGSGAEAARLYESAARKLFWRKDLWNQAGLAAYKGGDNGDSIRLLEIARESNSLSSQGWNTLGILYWMNHDVTTAITVWSSGLHSFPKSTVLYDQLIVAYHDQNDFTDEQIALEKRLSLGEDPAAHYRLGLLLTLSDIPRAIEQFNAASNLDPQFKPATSTLQFALMASEQEPDQARKYVIIGRGLGLVEEWGIALKAFENAVRVDNRNAEAWAWLGEAHQHQGQDGIAELNKAIVLGPKDTVVLGLWGLYWKRQGKYLNALAEYQQAAQIEPENPAWQVSIGEAYTLNGDLVSALSAYQNATSLAPADATYWRLLAMFCTDNVIRVADVGLPAAQKAADLAPSDPQVLDVLGYSYLNAGYLYNAEQNLLKAVKAAPDYAQAHIHLAETYLEKGDRTSAFNELTIAHQLDPNGVTGQLAAQLLNQYFP